MGYKVDTLINKVDALIQEINLELKTVNTSDDVDQGEWIHNKHQYNDLNTSITHLGSVKNKLENYKLRLTDK